MEKEKEIFIINKILSGDTQQYKKLVDEYSAQVFSLVRDIVYNYQDAQDITQEVFVKSFFSLEKYRQESSFFSWIYRIAYNESISFLRKKNNRNSLSFIDNINYDENFTNNFSAFLCDDSLELKLIKESKLNRLQQALKKLDADEQFLIINFYYKNYSITDLQNATGLSESNIKVKLHRIKKRLKDYIIE